MGGNEVERMVYLTRKKTFLLPTSEHSDTKGTLGRGGGAPHSLRSLQPSCLQDKPPPTAQPYHTQHPQQPANEKERVEDGKKALGPAWWSPPSSGSLSSLPEKQEIAKKVGSHFGAVDRREGLGSE